MGTLFWIILIVVVLIILYLFVTTYEISQQVIHPHMRTLDEIAKRHTDEKIFEMPWYDGLKKEELTFKSEFGYDIRGIMVYNPKPTDNVIIVSHGVTMRSEHSAKYVNIVMNMGYNALLIDQRCHGETGGDVVTYGYYEKHDLAQVINWTKEHYKGKIGLHGESMGAGISMQAVEVADVDFVLDDCGYSGFDEEVKHQIRSTGYVINAISYPLARWAIKRRGGYDIEDVSPIKALAKSEMPIMIIHGSIDKYVPYYMADIIYKSIPHDKKMKYEPEAKHACALLADPVEYEKQVKVFLTKYDLYFGE